MDKQKDKQNNIRKAEDIFDAVKNQNLGKRNLMSTHAQNHTGASRGIAFNNPFNSLKSIYI